MLTEVGGVERARSDGDGDGCSSKDKSNTAQLVRSLAPPRASSKSSRPSMLSPIAKKRSPPSAWITAYELWPPTNVASSRILGAAPPSQTGGFTDGIGKCANDGGIGGSGGGSRKDGSSAAT